ncbi:MAG: vapC [Hydrocarboniphaga sp.]|uniref:type II toxin-antitoxin system VapC family toxin n=1 Tax=Hydrocarboniphaga sp. TaxID=2033016 RepID=UPI002602AE7A|nr:type II toxin-antitoxin system VapC family toxin [Hydrocarboniphaga sp.]MDB5972797.1 vapC [Hydrocarboniphaga sp.]
MFLLDTNVVSELRKARSGRADPNVAAWARSVPSSALYLSVVTVMELEHGIQGVKGRDPNQFAALRTWMDDFVLSAFAGRILDFDLPAAIRYAGLSRPQTRPLRDSMIASTALHHGMRVVTRDESDFKGMVSVLNPWLPAP